MFDVAFDTEQLTEIKAKKKTKEVLTVLLLAGFMLTSQVFTACTSSPSVTEEVSQESITGTAGTVQLYHVEDDGVVPDSERYQLKQPDSISDSIEEVMNQLVLLNGLSFTGYSIDKDGNIVLYLMEDGLTEEQLLLSKAAIVKSVSGLNKTGDTVITIDDAAGNEIDSAIYRDNAFFYYDDAEDSAINKGEIILYLPNEHGNRLRKVTAYVTISSDESASEAVMKQLIAYNVLPSGTEIRSISVMNGTATLDLSGEFLTGDVTAGDRIVIYSIVNSLTSLQNVRGVLFLVNGKSIDNFHDVVDTSIPLEFSDE